MTCPKLNALLAVVAFAALSGCASSTTARYAVPASPIARGRVSQLLSQFAQHEGLPQASLGLPDYIGGFFPQFVRYQDSVVPAIFLMGLDMHPGIEARLLETRRFHLHPSARFLYLDAQLQSEFRRVFHSHVQFSTHTDTSLW